MDKKIIKANTTTFDNRQESLVCITTCLLIVAPSIIDMFNRSIRSFITIPFKLDTLFIYGVFFLIILYSIKTILHRASILIYSIVAVLLFGYLISFMGNSYYYNYYIQLGIDIFIQSAPWIFVAYAVRDYKLLKKYLSVSSYIILVSVLMNVIVFKIDIYGDSTYTQFYAYELLPVVIIMLNNLFDRIKWTDIIISITSFILMISMGARGPLLCVALYLVLKIILLYRFQIKKAFLISTISIAVILPVYTHLYDILIYMSNIFQGLNLSTRMIARLMEGSFLQDYTRNLLKKYSVDLIGEHPLIGVGIGKDRILLGDKLGSSNLTLEVIGWYPHNIFLEILLHFGIIIGCVIIIYMLKILYTITLKNMHKDAVDVICIFISIGLFPLLVSGSYITWHLFYALMGLCLYQYKSVNINKEKNKKTFHYKE